MVGRPSGAVVTPDGVAVGMGVGVLVAVGVGVTNGSCVGVGRSRSGVSMGIMIGVGVGVAGTLVGLDPGAPDVQAMAQDHSTMRKRADADRRTAWRVYWALERSQGRW
jgi:hypothetical protein